MPPRAKSMPADRPVNRHARYGPESQEADKGAETLRAYCEHGGYGTPEYRAYWNMLQRCYNPKIPRYSAYGALGVKVCDRWLGPGGFERFLEDMGHRPSPKHSIDRKDTRGSYEPDNCRWATRKEQDSNLRRSRLLTHNGETRTITEWSRLTGLTQKTIRRRLEKEGMSDSEALTAEKRARRSSWLEFKGERMTINQWAARAGMDPKTLVMRLLRWDGDVAKALTTPVSDKRRDAAIRVAQARSVSRSIDKE